MTAIGDPLSIAGAAREAGDRPAIITRDRVLSFAACARAAADLDATADAAYVVATPTVATVVALYAALEARRPIALVHPEQTVRPPLPHDAGLVLFTSGSTSEPRGVVHTRAIVLAAAHAHPLAWQPADRWLLCLSLAHAGGAAIVIRCLVARVPVVLHDSGFDAASVAHLARERCATLASLVPSQVDALVDCAPLPSLRAVLLGGAHAAPSLLARAAAAGLPVLPTYGLTETFGQIATARAPGEPLRALAGVELTGGTQDAPERIAVTGPMLAARYLDGEPIAPRFTTSDLGFVDDDGAVHVVGRADDVIVTGGKKVHPASVEAVLLATPGVSAACVFPVADARWGAVVAAAVAVDPATFDRERAFATWHLALPAHARPRRIAALPALPVLPSGKLDRRAARALPTSPVAYRA